MDIQNPEIKDQTIDFPKSEVEAHIEELDYIGQINNGQFLMKNIIIS